MKISNREKEEECNFEMWRANWMAYGCFWRERRFSAIVIIGALFVCFQKLNVAKTEQYENVFTLSDEKRLIKRLLNNYADAGITGRPVQHTNERVLVNMSLSLIQILDLDEKNQVLTISVWVLFHWMDHILQWNPKNYSGIEVVRVPPKQVWTPDIVLYNYADERLKEMRDALVLVKYNGAITWMPPAIFKSNCKIDIKRFPFDEQICHMKFGSWTYDGNRLDVLFIDDERHVLLDDYTESNEWEIVARPAMRNVKFYPCCQEPYPDLTYFLFLRRNAAFFSYILVLPCVLLALLTLVIFWLPPESPAKMVLGMNIFVAFFLLLLLLADSTPQASTSVPYLGYYYCLNMILITLSSFLSVIVINLYFRGDRRNRVPPYIRKICEFLTRKKEFKRSSNSETTSVSVEHVSDSEMFTSTIGEKQNVSSLHNETHNTTRILEQDALLKRNKKTKSIRFSSNHLNKPQTAINEMPNANAMPNMNNLARKSRIRSNQQAFSTTARSQSMPSSVKRSAGGKCQCSLRCLECSAESVDQSRHQKHPQNCNVCMRRRLNLGTERTRLLEIDDQINCGHNEIVKCTENYGKQTTLKTPCEHMKYIYQHGKLFLVPSACGSCFAKCHTEAEEYGPEYRFVSIESLEKDLKEICQIMRSCLSTVVKKESDEIIIREWRTVAIIMDRIFFLFYLVIHVCAAFSLLIPNSHETNVVEFLRDYRLRNYNSTFTEEEAKQLSPMALMPKKSDATGTHTSDRFTPGRLSTQNMMQASNSESHTKTVDPNLLSPYQKFSDTEGDKIQSRT